MNRNKSVINQLFSPTDLTVEPGMSTTFLRFPSKRTTQYHLEKFRHQGCLKIPDVSSIDALQDNGAWRLTVRHPKNLELGLNDEEWITYFVGGIEDSTLTEKLDNGMSLVSTTGIWKTDEAEFEGSYQTDARRGFTEMSGTNVQSNAVPWLKRNGWRFIDGLEEEAVKDDLDELLLEGPGGP